MRRRTYTAIRVIAGCSILLNLYLLNTKDITNLIPSYTTEEKFTEAPSQDQILEIDTNLMTERRTNLKKYCVKHTKHDMHVNNMTKEFMIYHEDTHTLMCLAPKMGTTFWVRVIHYLRAKHRYTSPFMIPDTIARGSVKRIKNMHLPETDLKKLLHNSKRYIFVRNPFERLYSLYFSKLFTPNGPYMNILGTYVIRETRKTFSPITSECGSDVTFTELVQYLIKVVKRHQTPDEHLELVTNVCSPCLVDYDFVAKVESFKTDGVYLLSELGYSDHEITDIVGYEKIDRFEREFTSFFKQPEKVYINTCLNLTERIKRFWTKMKAIGLYHASEEIPNFSHQLPNVTDIYSFAWQSFYKAKSLPGLNKQKQDTMLAEYAKLDRSLILQLEEVLKPDVEAFGYETISSKLFEDS